MRANSRSALRPRRLPISARVAALINLTLDFATVKSIRGFSGSIYEGV